MAFPFSDTAMTGDCLNCLHVLHIYLHVHQTCTSRWMYNTDGMHTIYDLWSATISPTHLMHCPYIEHGARDANGNRGPIIGVLRQSVLAEWPWIAKKHERQKTQTQRKFVSPNTMPPGKHTENYGKSPLYSWVNQLFQWAMASIAVVLNYHMGKKNQAFADCLRAKRDGMHHTSWHFIWHIFWHSIWHPGILSWHTIGHLIWPTDLLLQSDINSGMKKRHPTWHIFWHILTF